MEQQNIQNYKSKFTAQEIDNKLENSIQKDNLTTTGEANKIPVLNENNSINAIGVKYTQQLVGPVNTKNWYRIYIHDNYVTDNIILNLFLTNDSSHLTFSITTSISNTNITQLSGNVAYGGIDKIRVITKPTRSYLMYIDVHSLGTDRTLYVNGHCRGTLQAPVIVDEEVPEGYTVTEFIPGNGFKSSSPLNADALNIKNIANVITSLSSLTKSGIYYSSNTNIINNLTDLPNTAIKHGTLSLEVINYENRYIQTLITRYDKSFKIHKRTWASSSTIGDWQEIATTDSTVASANKINVQVLTNEDLNDIKIQGLKYYFAYYNNSIINKPSNVNGFSLIACGNDIRFTQLLIKNDDYNQEFYYRNKFDSNNTEWSPWTRLITENDLNSIISRLEALENK